MSFMQQQIEYGTYYLVDGPNGIDCVPADLAGKVLLRLRWKAGASNRALVPEGLRDYCENSECYSVERKKGWGARLSAPGYMDCTPWSVYDTEQEAIDALAEMYGDDEEDSEQEG